MVVSYLFNLMPLKMAYYSTIIELTEWQFSTMNVTIIDYGHDSLTLVKTTLWELKTCSVDPLRSLIRTVHFGQLAMQLTPKSQFLHIEPQTHPYKEVFKTLI